MFAAIILVLAFRVSTNQKLAIALMATIGCLACYFFIRSLQYFVWGVNLYKELPASEINKFPESSLLYIVYLACFTVNVVLLACMVYVICYVAVMTY